jgi:signal transduction histidine kinase
MHAILGFAELLAGTEELPAATRRVQAGIVLDSGRRLLRLIDNLLDMSKLEAGKMTFALSEGDISPVIEAAISDLRGITGARSIRMTVMDRRRCVRTSFDPLRMAQVIANLLSNAVKFSPAGASVAIVLENAQSGSPGRLRIEVSDQGPGIAEDELEAIFDKFIQGSRTKTSAGGTGLGLAICREIVNAHSGRIWAANNSRGGASFFVEA